MKPYDISDLEIDFLQDHIHYSRKGHRGKQELIAKALGASKGIKRVLDLTCGLAEDAFFLAQIGFQVTALERSKPIYEVLAKAYTEARSLEPTHTALARLEILYSDSLAYLSSAEFLKMEKNDLALYIDPMFPEKKKSSLPRKQMQIFRQVVGDDLDGQELLRAALATDVSRVVVKRPLKAEPLGPGVIHSFDGKTVRYDLYVPPAH